MDKVLWILQLVAYVVAGAVVVLAGVSKMTDTDKDDKLLALLRKVEDFLAGIVIPKKLR